MLGTNLTGFLIVWFILGPCIILKVESKTLITLSSRSILIHWWVLTNFIWCKNKFITDFILKRNLHHFSQRSHWKFFIFITSYRHSAIPSVKNVQISLNYFMKQFIKLISNENCEKRLSINKQISSHHYYCFSFIVVSLQSLELHSEKREI